MTAEETCNLILEEFKARSGVKTYIGIDHMIIQYGSQGLRLPGVYSYIRKELYFCFENRPSRAIEILLHEMAHATSAALGRTMDASCDALYNYEEVIAETTAGMLLMDLGLMTAQRDADVMQYLSVYSRDLTDRTIEQAKDHAREAADYILKNWLPDFAESCRKKAA